GTRAKTKITDVGCLSGKNRQSIFSMTKAFCPLLSNSFKGTEAEDALCTLSVLFIGEAGLLLFIGISLGCP
ncbi:MAG: hypothetical protein PHP67_02910, partial [Sphaerochaeta sp.]|nr:hypothetical protein [Sphaerochaeta sp.]